MARQIFAFDPTERFVAGTVGQPGERTFFLQARSGRRVVSVALEKAQVTLLAERLDALLDEVVRATGDPDIPASAPADLDPLDTPVTEEFRVGAMSLGWDQASRRVVLEMHAQMTEDTEIAEIGDDSDEEYADTVRVFLTGSQSRSFVARARAVVAAGRPPCPFCNLPLEAAGHICPRANGYRRRS